MAYRRRHGNAGGRSTFMKETTISTSTADINGGDVAIVSNSNSSSSLAAQAIRASAAHRDSSHSSAYTYSNLHKGGGAPIYDYTSMGSSNEAGSFWGVLARKAKAILDDDVPYEPTEYPTTLNHDHQVEIMYKKVDNNNPTIRKGIDAFTTKINRIGDTIGNALEEGRTIVENKTADIIQETRKLQIRRKGDEYGSMQQQHQSTHSQNLTSQEDQIKASRDVAMATAAKAKLLLRELKTVKADLAFAKQRCSQLEEENKILRDARDKGVHPEEDDMIRLQLETLLAEKSRLANENSVYARENRFLREIVEYHQLTMQDVIYIDEGIEEVTEVASRSRMSSMSPPTSPSSPSRSSSASSVSLTFSLSKDNIINMQLPPRDAIHSNIHRSDSLPTLALLTKETRKINSPQGVVAASDHL